MIFKRFTFTLVCFVLSGFGFSHSLAAQPNSSLTASEERKTFVADGALNNGISDHSHQEDLQFGKIVHQAVQVEPLLISAFPQSSQVVATASQADLDQPAISRRWSLGAMGLTFTVALFLLWILFRPPSQKLVNDEPRLQQNKIQSKPESESIADRGANAETSRLDSAQVTSEAASQAVATVANIDITQELIHDLQGRQESAPETSSESAISAHTAARRKAIWKLSKTGDCRSIEPLLKTIPEVGTADQSLILDAVAQISHRRFKPINDELFVALQHQNPEVRLSAIRDLRRLYQFVIPVITKIAQMQSDPDYEVRQTATQTLHQLNSNPLPTFNNHANPEITNLVSGEDSEANLHLVAYLLAELDTKG